MQGILKGTSKLIENLALKRPRSQIFAAETAGQVRLNQYYSSSWKYLLYKSLIWIDLGFAFARQRGLRSNSKGKFLRKLPLTSKIASRSKVLPQHKP